MENLRSLKLHEAEEDRQNLTGASIENHIENGFQLSN